MAIMIVSSYLPYPLFNGGNIRLYNLIKNLSKKHKITLICEIRKNQTEKDVEEIKRFCTKVITVPRKKQWSLSNILKAGFSLNPFLIVGHESPEMKAKIKQELLENNYDLIHVETFYVLQNLPRTSLPIVLAEHNVEHLVYKRYVNETARWMRPVLNIDIVKLKKSEIDAWRIASQMVAVSQEEKEIIEKSVATPVTLVPNGVDTETFKFNRRKEGKEKLILFIGDFRWIENRDSVKWIVEKIWPKINNKFNTKLWIVGRNIPKGIQTNPDKNILFDSNLPDTAKIYEKAYILLSPIKVGGGTSFKILEAMASGVPVVTSALGAEGIGKDILLTGETSTEIAEKVEELLINIQLYESKASQARKFVEKNFNWEDITERLNKVYSKTLND